MKIWLQLLFYSISILLKLLQPGGAKAIIAENIMLKKQLVILNRSRRRSPKLSVLDRIMFGFFTSLINLQRLSKICIVLKPATLLNFHKILVKKKYRKLFSAKSPKKPGPKGPSKEVINIENSKISFPTMKIKKRVIVGTQVFWIFLPCNNFIKHAAKSNTVNITSVSCHAYNTSGKLIHYYHYP